MVIILLFWSLDYDPSKDGPMTYFMVFEHGILAFIVLIDGNIISRIPLRLKHGLSYQAYNFTYLTWTVLFALSTASKSPIYDVLDWNNDPSGAATVASIVLLVICPLIFVFCWWFSLPRRRLYQERKDFMSTSNDDTGYHDSNGTTS